MYILFQLFRLASLAWSAFLMVDCNFNIDSKNSTVLFDDDSPICLASDSWYIVSLTCSILTSIICICLLNQKVLPKLRPVGYTVVLKCLFLKPYSWSLSSFTVVVIAYDIVALRWQLGERRKIAMLWLLIFYKLVTLFLIYQLNFTYPPSKARDFRFTSIAGYFITLSIFFLDNLWAVAVVAANVASKVNDSVPNLLSIRDYLISMVINASLYNSFLHFFWQKIFRGDKNILSMYKQNFADTSGIKEHCIPDEDPEGGEGGSAPPPPHPQT